MNLHPFRFLSLAALVAAAIVPAGRAVAETAKAPAPVAVISIAKIDDNLRDLGYLSRAAKVKDENSRMVLFLARGFTTGLDTKRPAGAYMVPSKNGIEAVYCLPLSDLDEVLETHKEAIGEPKKLDDGVLEVGVEKTLYLLPKGDWLYVADSKALLDSVPADPLPLLGDLPEKYNFALRVLSRNIPTELKDIAVDEFKVIGKRYLETALAAGGDNVNPEDSEKMFNDSVEGLERLIRDTDEFLLGIDIDSETKKLRIDIQLTAVAGTKLATEMAQSRGEKSNFSGFLVPKAAMTYNLSTKLPKSTIEQFQFALKKNREDALKRVDNDPDMPAEDRAEAREHLGKLFDVVSATVATGVVDGAGSVVLEPDSINFISGMQVSDSKKIDEAIKGIVEMKKDDPEFPEYELNVETHAGVTFHNFTAPIPEKETEARDIFGEEVDVYVGIGPKAVYVGLGPDALDMLKQAIDASAGATERQLPAFQLNFALLPILRFVDSVDERPNLPALIALLEKSGNDHVGFSAKSIDRGASYSIEVDEGVISVGGQAVQLLMQNLQQLSL